MGIQLSKEDPPKLVVVPPLFERDHRGRSRMCKSSYEFNFCKPKLKWLFNNYMLPGGALWLNLQPPEDTRVSVKARLDTRSLDNPANSVGGSLTLRFQPVPDEPLTFADIRAGTWVGGNSARVRSCVFHRESGLGAFAAAQVKHSGISQASLSEAGLRYSSPYFSTGLIAGPIDGTLKTLWMVARSGPMCFGFQYEPSAGVDFSRLSSSTPVSDLWSIINKDSSYAVSYTPQAATPYGQGTFSAAVELRQQQQLLVSFLHHMAIQRRCHNPLEKADVVGITNYVDIGLQMEANIGGSQSTVAAADGNGVKEGTAVAPAAAPGVPLMRLAASWQVNKNMLVKARLGLDGLMGMVAMKGWWAPSLTVAACGGWDVQKMRPTVGIHVGIENYGNLSYERAPPAWKKIGGALNQRHVASQEDLDAAEGLGVTVPLESQQDPTILGQVQTPSANYL